MQNVDFINLLFRCKGDAVCKGLIANHRKQFPPSLVGELLAVIQSGNPEVGRQDYRSRAHRPGQRASARFIHTADDFNALCVVLVLDLPHGQFLHSKSSGISSVNFPSLPLRNSSISTFAIRSVWTSPPRSKKPRFRPAISSSS